MTEIKPAITEERDFTADARHALGHLQTAVAGVLQSLAEPGERPNEIAHSLKIDRKLAWKIARLLAEPDPLMATRFLPGDAGIRTFVRAAKRRGAPADTCDAVSSAIVGLDEMTERHAGNRATLEMMATACGSRLTEADEISHRKASFQGNSYTWGMNARTQLWSMYLIPADRPGRVHLTSVRGFIDLRRLRPNVRWTIARARARVDSVDSEKTVIPPQSEPLDSSVSRDSDDPPGLLLREFSSDPLPNIQRVPGPDGYEHDQVVEGPIGNTGRTTCLIGEVMRDVGTIYRTPGDEESCMAVHVRTPCEALVLDYIVHEDLFGRIEPTMAVYSEMAGGPGWPEAKHAHKRLEIAGEVKYLGKGAFATRTSAVPPYPKLAQYVFDRMETDGDRYDVYRIMVAFPPIPATVALQHPLVDPPAG
jgi:hypothetical protein